MILVLGGTKDSREGVRLLKEAGFPVMVSVVSAYGGLLAELENPDEIRIKPLTSDELKSLIKHEGIDGVVDITHPYAQEISAIARAVCKEVEIPYAVFQRPQGLRPDHKLIHYADNYQEAAEIACSLGEIIFLTTGSKTLDVFTTVVKKHKKQIIARVLPDEKVMKHCFDLGLKPKEIIAMQGPFGIDLNKTMYQHYGAQVVVTKDSGPAGGFEDKVKAALDLAISLVIIRRPEQVGENCYGTFQEVINYLVKYVKGGD